MLVIRDEQLRALDRVAEERFRERACEHLREVWPDECEALGEAGLRERVSSAARRCQGYGLEGEWHVVSFLELTFRLGPTFDTDLDLPWAQEVLQDDASTPGEKIAALEACAAALAEEGRR